MSVSTQVHVSPDTGAVNALYVWSEENDWQAGFSVARDGACTAWLGRKDETGEDIFLHPDGGQQAAFPSLHAALAYYMSHPLAVKGLAGPVDSHVGVSGEIVLG